MRAQLCHGQIWHDGGPAPFGTCRRQAGELSIHHRAEETERVSRRVWKMSPTDIGAEFGDTLLWNIPDRDRIRRTKYLGWNFRPEEAGRSEVEAAEKVIADNMW